LTILWLLVVAVAEESEAVAVAQEAIEPVQVLQLPQGLATQLLLVVVVVAVVVAQLQPKDKEPQAATVIIPYLALLLQRLVVVVVPALPHQTRMVTTEALAAAQDLVPVLPEPLGLAILLLQHHHKETTAVQAKTVHIAVAVVVAAHQPLEPMQVQQQARLVVMEPHRQLQEHRLLMQVAVAVDATQELTMLLAPVVRVVAVMAAIPEAARLGRITPEAVAVAEN
jgi:hypothetical protein